MKNGTEISIIMPVYNAERYIREAVDSVLRQSFPEFELLLVDDGSTDGSGALCDEYARSDSRVRVLHQQNGGICRARNAGLKAAEGKYVAFIDNDDVIASDTLEDNYALALTCHADWVKFGKTEIMVRGNKILKRQDSVFPKGVYSGREMLGNILKFRCQSVLTFVWDSLFRRKIIEENSLRFDTAFKYGNEDIDFCERYLFLCEKLVINPRCYYKHFTRLGISTSSKYSQEAIDLHLYLQGKSNQRYGRIEGLDVRTNPDYFTCITRSQIVPVCQKINDAGKLLNRKEKIRALQEVWKDKSLRTYVHEKMPLRKQNRKLAIYRFLFVKKYFQVLLLFDRYSRKIVYSVRGIGVTIK